LRPKAPAPMTATRRADTLLLRGGRWSEGELDGLAAAGVEVEQMGDLVVGFGAGRNAEAGRGGSGGLGEVGGPGDKFEEIEGDVFAAACGGGALVHEGDGSGCGRVRANAVIL
jgi:hypothetical protein